MIKFEFTVDNELKLTRALLDYSNKFASFKSVMNKIADDFYKTEEQVFLHEGAWEGRKAWQKLSPYYEQAKMRTNPGAKILEKTGSLKRSLTLRNDPNAVCVIKDNSIEIDSKVRTPDKKHKLLTLHSRGWNKPEIRPKNASILVWEGPAGKVFSAVSRAVKVPARPPIDLSELQKQRWMKFFHVFIMEEQTKGITEFKVEKV